MDRAGHKRTPGLRKLAALIDAIGAGMLTSVEPGGALVSRPMTPLELDASGSLWFFTRAVSKELVTPSVTSSPLIATAPPLVPTGRFADGESVNMAFSQPDDASYVSVSGRAWLVRDAVKIRSFWSSTATMWFPGGIDDPDIALLRVDIEAASYWNPGAGVMSKLLPEA